MEKKLGRGLSALIPETSEGKEKVVYLNLDDIRPSRYQPRERFPESKLEELIASMKEKGVIQPILVRPTGDGKYELIAGERRLRAAKALNMQQIPGLIKEVSDLDALELSLIENIQREELNAIEEAHAFRRLCDEFNFTHERIGQAIGKDRSTIANIMRLLLLPEKIQSYVANNTISMGHARAVLSLQGEKAQIRFCDRIIKRGLSVRQTESLVKKLARPIRRAVAKNHHLSSIEEELQYLLGTRVKIIYGKKRGKIEIQYYSSDDLERILKILRK